MSAQRTLVSRVLVLETERGHEFHERRQSGGGHSGGGLEARGKGCLRAMGP